MSSNHKKEGAAPAPDDRAGMVDCQVQPLPGGDFAVVSSSPTGRLSQEDPDFQNFPGTLAHKLEMYWSRYGYRRPR